MADNESYGVDKIRFSELEGEPLGQRIDKKMLADIPVEATVELGRAKVTLREVLELAEGSIINLDKPAGEALDIKVGGKTIGQGEVIAVDDFYGIRITKVDLK